MDWQGKRLKAFKILAFGKEVAEHVENCLATAGIWANKVAVSLQNNKTPHGAPEEQASCVGVLGHLLGLPVALGHTTWGYMGFTILGCLIGVLGVLKQGDPTFCRRVLH